MSYPKIPDYHKLVTKLASTARFKHERGSKHIDDLLEEIHKNIQKGVEELKLLEEDHSLYLTEPDDYESIIKLRPNGPRVMVETVPKDFTNKLKGAFLSRIAGCILGSPVEFNSIDEMENWAKYTNQQFPPIDYWHKTKHPFAKRYGKSDFIEYTKEGMTKVPVDDDIMYTLLNLLLVEDFGKDFSTQDVATLWKKYLPYACTAEEVALNHINSGIYVQDIADIDNPYNEWIGADIRSDAFAYIAPGNPELAAKMAYKDAYLSHRRNGIYGEMFFAAAQSAAFVVDDSLEAIRIGLTEIPKDCRLAIDIKWALNQNPKDYREARNLVEERFEGMEHAHTNNNACLTVFGLKIGNNDITKTISLLVAMGMDNDCTAATAGSIVGAISGFNNLEEQWYKNFNNTIDSYLIGIDEFNIDDVLNRFEQLAKSK